MTTLTLARMHTRTHTHHALHVQLQQTRWKSSAIFPVAHAQSDKKVLRSMTTAVCLTPSKMHPTGKVCEGSICVRVYSSALFDVLYF